MRNINSPSSLSSDFRRILSTPEHHFENLPFGIHDQTFTFQALNEFPVIRAIALIFYSIRKQIETELKQEMRNVVLTVPTGFDLAKRQTMAKAASIAGFNVLHVLNEPVAAAISYYAAKPDEKKTVCVVDFGGGKLDVANIEIEKGRIESSANVCTGKLRLTKIEII